MSDVVFSVGVFKYCSGACLPGRTCTREIYIEICVWAIHLACFTIRYRLHLNYQELESTIPLMSSKRKGINFTVELSH